jgi:hypothetical protein
MIIYRDAYLKRFCSDELEALAYQNVDDLGTFTASWRDRLATLQVYMIACQENQASPDDLYTEKYKMYKKEFDGLLVKAQTDLPDDEGNYAAVFTVNLERG